MENHKEELRDIEYYCNNYERYGNEDNIFYMIFSLENEEINLKKDIKFYNKKSYEYAIIQKIFIKLFMDRFGILEYGLISNILKSREDYLEITGLVLSLREAQFENDKKRCEKFL